MARSRRSLGLALGALLLAGTTLSACGGSSSGDGGTGTPGGSAAVSASAVDGTGAPSAQLSGYPSVPSGVALTAPGTALQLGQSATVAWKPTQKLTGILDIAVTAVHSTTFKKSFKGWELEDATKASAPYFVTATVRNTGRSDLSGQAVPLYGSAASGALVEASSFASSFKPCHPGVLPTPFPAGASADVCLVYLVPSAGQLDGVSFRPSEAFDPITWSGDVTPLGKGKHKTPSVSSPLASNGVSPTAPPASPTASPDVHMSGSPVR